MIEAIRKAAVEAMENAYCPYSGYRVGAALVDAEGRLHVGVNFENVSFGATICAERNAIGAMVAAGGRKIQAMAIATVDGAMPCGICCQVIAEFAIPELEIDLVDASGAANAIRFADLFPSAFQSDRVGRADQTS